MGTRDHTGEAGDAGRGAAGLGGCGEREERRGGGGPGRTCTHEWMGETAGERPGSRGERRARRGERRAAAMARGRAMDARRRRRACAGVLPFVRRSALVLMIPGSARIGAEARSGTHRALRGDRSLGPRPARVTPMCPIRGPARTSRGRRAALAAREVLSQDLGDGGHSLDRTERHEARSPRRSGTPSPLPPRSPRRRPGRSRESAPGGSARGADPRSRGQGASGRRCEAPRAGERGAWVLHGVREGHLSRQDARASSV